MVESDPLRTHLQRVVQLDSRYLADMSEQQEEQAVQTRVQWRSGRNVARHLIKKENKINERLL